MRNRPVAVMRQVLKVHIHDFQIKKEKNQF
jgi:hypothetical protein